MAIPSIENLLNPLIDANDFDFKFDWMLSKDICPNRADVYRLNVVETTIWPEFSQFCVDNAGNYDNTAFKTKYIALMNSKGWQTALRKLKSTLAEICKSMPSLKMVGIASTSFDEVKVKAKEIYGIDISKMKLHVYDYRKQS